MTVVLDSIEHVWVEFYNSIGLKFSSRQTKTKTRSYCLKLKKKKRNPWISKSNSINLDLLHLSFFNFLQMALSFAQSLNVKIEKKKSQKIKITQTHIKQSLPNLPPPPLHCSTHKQTHSVAGQLLLSSSSSSHKHTHCNHCRLSSLARRCMSTNRHCLIRGRSASSSSSRCQASILINFCTWVFAHFFFLF